VYLKVYWRRRMWVETSDVQATLHEISMRVEKGRGSFVCQAGTQLLDDAVIDSVVEALCDLRSGQGSHLETVVSC